MDRDNLDPAKVEEDVKSILGFESSLGTTKEQLVLARIGQGVFRKSVLSRWNYRCAVTGSSLVIRASHIKPWRACDDSERLDPNNGLPLVATLDALFDSHLITFKPSGVIQMSERIPTFERKCLGITVDMKLRREPTLEMRAYLESHRENLIA
jgi:putative restriction endonuclease